MPDLAQLLDKTSRTFGLCIPFLPEPVRRQVNVAYLLFRVADTFEDATHWSKSRRIRALRSFSRLLDDPSESTCGRLVAEWLQEGPSEHAGYLELIAEVPFVLEQFRELPAAARAAIEIHTRRTASGMSEFLTRGDDPHELHLETFEDLRDYCYVVAGIVGEMLTELYLLDDERLGRIAGFLRQRAASFGEGLQLTNIVKDFLVDASEGRSFLPSGDDAPRALAQARANLEVAAEYTLALQQAGAARGIVTFNALPLLLARATLDRVEQDPGQKLSRPEVFAIVNHVNSALDREEPVVNCRNPVSVLEANR